MKNEEVRKLLNARREGREEAAEMEKAALDKAAERFDPSEHEPPAGVARPLEVARELIKLNKARKGLIDFAKFIDPTYDPYEVHELIGSKLEDVEAGRCRRLAVFIPPATGKSRLASELFPAWVMGRNINFELIEGSYNKEKASEFGAVARDIIQDPRYALVFPGTEISQSAAAADAWKTTEGGSYKASGVAGGIIGFHAHIAIIDDPFKNAEEARSLQHRQNVWDWYASVLINRLRSYKDGSGSVVLIMQRWHDDDIGGRVEKLNDAGEEDWEILSIPSIAEAGDPLRREEGEPLLPDGPNRRPLEELYAIRARSPQLFQALHQQKPISDEGDLFKPDWLMPYEPNKLPRGLTFYGTSDWALTKGSGDYTVHLVFGVCERGHIYLTDLFREQTDIIDGVEACLQLMKNEKRKPLKWFNERVVLSKAIGPVLRKRMKDEKLWTILQDVSVAGFGSKDSPDRAGSIAGAMQMGYVHVPMSAPWLGPLEHELSRFPRGRYDDQVDALTLIGMQLNKLRGQKAEPVPEIGVPVLTQASHTFNDLMHRSALRRAGIAPVKEAPMLAPVGDIEWPESYVD